MADQVARELLAKATPAELEKAADMATAEAFLTGEPLRGNQMLLLATLARAVASLERENIAWAEEIGAAHYHVGAFKICGRQDHTRTLTRQLAGLPCDLTSEKPS